MMLINRMGSLILPFLTLYTTKELGWTTVKAGIAASCFGIGSMLGALVGGWLVDKLGYWKVIMIGQFGAAIGFACLPFFTSFYPLCLALFLASFVSDILRPGVMTGVSKIADDESKTRSISLMRMAFNLGFAIGPAAAGILIEVTSYQSIFVIDALTCLSAAIVGFFLIHKDVPTSKSLIDHEVKKTTVGPFRDVPFMYFMLFSLLMLIAFFQLLSTVPLFIKDVLLLSEQDVGIFFTINGLLIFVSEMPIVHFTERKWRLMPAMIVGGLMIGVSFLALMLPFSAWWLIVICAILISYGEIVNFPFITSLTLRRTNDFNMGKYMGVISMLFSVALIISPIMGTYLVEHWGFDTLWLACFLLCAIACLGWFWLDKHFKKKKVLI